MLASFWEIKKAASLTRCGLLGEEGRSLLGDQRAGAQRAVLVALGDGFDRDRLIIAGMACLAELGHALRNYFFHGFASGLKVVARIELLRALREHFADGACDGEAIVGVDVDFADAILDAELNLLDRNAPRRLELA